MRVLVISDVNRLSPAFRYRVLDTLHVLEKQNLVDCEILPFYDVETMKILGSRQQLRKVFMVLRDLVYFLYRFWKIRDEEYDVLYVKNYIFPILARSVESIVFRYVKAKKVFYDIDDAIYLNQTRAENHFFNYFRNAASKVRFWIQKADTVFLPNATIKRDLEEIYPPVIKKSKSFLTAPFLKQYFSSAEEIPEAKSSDEIYVIWLGSPHTQIMLPILDDFVRKLPHYIPKVQFLLLGTNSQFNMWSDIPYVHFIPWSEDNERRAMIKANFGLNPLRDSSFEKRKSAFKVIQYYRAGIVPLVSDVGINRELVKTYGGYVTKDFSDVEAIANYMQMIMTQALQVYQQIYQKSVSLSVESNAEIIHQSLLE